VGAGSLWPFKSQDAVTNYSAWYDITENLGNQNYTNWLKLSTRMAPLQANQAQSILARVKCSVVHASVNFVYLKFFFLHLHLHGGSVNDFQYIFTQCCVNVLGCASVRRLCEAPL